MTNKIKSIAVLIVLLACSVVFAQSNETAKSSQSSEAASKESKLFRLDYVLREMDGSKEISKRNYTISVRSGQYKQLRTGSRVPVITGEPVGGHQNYQYMDVGINIDSQVREDAGGTSMEVSAELSSIAAAEGTQSTPSLPPLVRQEKVNASVPLTPGKSILVFSVDEPTSSHRFELSVTPTSLR